jgi:hypothetical protein
MKEIIVPASGSRFAGLNFRAVATDPLIFVVGAAHREDGSAAGGLSFASVREEVAFCFDGMDELLKRCGSSLSLAAKTLVFLTERSYWTEMNDEFLQRWEAGDYPTRCTFYAGLPGTARGSFQLEAVRPGGAFEHGVAATLTV